MLIRFHKNRILCWFLCILFLVAVGIPSLIGGYAVEADGGELGLYMTADKESAVGERGLILCAEGSLYESAEGGALALRVTLRLSEGWAVEEVTTCPATEGMTVTVGSRTGEVRILLDGYPPDLEAEAGDASLLRIRLIRTEGNSPLRATLANGEFYYIDPNSEIYARPVSLPKNSTPNSDDIFFSEETTEKRDDMISETTSEVMTGDDTRPPEKSTAESDDTPLDMSGDMSDTQETTRAEEPVTAFPSVFVGCQETTVREGEYAVRFLFFGSTPVICGEGGGLLRMEITKAHAIEEDVGKKIRRHEGNWSVCTFYGLREDRSYSFLVYTDEKVVYIIYKNGKLCFL